MKLHTLVSVLSILLPLGFVGLIFAADQPQWGQRYSRNMVSSETNLPDSFDLETGRNVRWSVPLGTACYSTPIIAEGHVLVGTNNSQPRDPKHDGDRGVMFCLNESDGSLVWQLVVPKLSADRFFDWPQAGMCSTAVVEGDRVYTLTNRDEVICLDLQGLSNGNDGPYRDEASHMVPVGQPALEVGPLDADILWLLDLREAAGVRPHDSTHCGILVDNNLLYINTSNGLTSRHDGVDKPEAPSLVVVDKTTGRLLAREREGISRKIFHCTWSSPAMGQTQGHQRVYFCGGDGICYGFEPLKFDASMKNSTIATMECSWRFDCDPTAPKEDVHNYIRNRRESPSNIKSMPVFYEDRLYVTSGGDIWWGKQQARLQCIDVSGSGDVTNKALVWSYPVKRHCCSTPAICDGLAYVPDCAGNLHCVDIETGEAVWVEDIGAETWASPLVADGKVYIGTRRGVLWILAAGRQPKVLSSTRLPDPIYSTCTAANGMLYVSTMTQLYALTRDAVSP